MLARILPGWSVRAVRLHSRRSPRRALAVGVVVFVAATLGCGWAMDRADAFRDPIYGRKETKLLAIPRANGPLILVIGSSRIENGVNARHAETVLQRVGNRSATIFNFGSAGAGPMTMSVYLQRLLDRGTVPDRIVIEVLPKLLSDTADGPPELAWLNPERFSESERAELERLSPKGTAHWHKPTGNPWTDHAKSIVFHLHPALLTPAASFPWTQPMDDRGWYPFFHSQVTPELRASWTLRAERECRPNLATFEPDSVSARVFRQIIESCRERGIPIHLLLMPEGTVFHGWYGPGVNERLAKYLATLPVPVTDARNWLPDEAFADGHHLLPAGATAFSERLAIEVLQPLLEGRSP